MRRLTIIVAIVAALYSAYWFIGARTLNQTAQSQIALLRDEGWQIDYTDLAVNGYPSRFDTTITDLNIAAPDGTIGYAASFVQGLALSYQPNSAILVFPDTQDVVLNDVPFTVDATGLRASAKVNANAALSLDALTAEATDIALRNVDFGEWRFTNMIAALREAGPLPNSYDVYGSVQDIRPPEELSAQFNRSGTLPATIEIAKLDATVTLDRPLNRHTLPDWQGDPGRLRGLDVKSVLITWGELSIRGRGELTIRSDGTPDGTLTVTANDWQRMLNLAQEAGFIPADYQFIAQSVGQTLSGGATDLVLPITFQNGNLSIGPIPLGPAPRFY